MNNEPLGWAQITHPFHPLRGETFLILKIRRYGGVETVSLRGPSDGTFAVPLEWTDKATPSPYEQLGIPAPILDVRRLAELVDLVQSLDRHSPKGLDL